MTEFRNPYHFVPVSSQGTTDQAAKSVLEVDQQIQPVQVGGEFEHLTHDRYVGATKVAGKSLAVRSGRILCRLTVERPTSVGGEQKTGEDESTQVTPYLHADGQPGIPSTSLRGTISSIAEAASNSAMRVLSNERMSVRKSVLGKKTEERPLSALGMILTKEEEGKATIYKLWPLTLPTLSGHKSDDLFRLPTEYHAFAANLPVYIHGYFHDKQSNSVHVSRGSFLDDPTINSWSSTNFDDYWFMDVNGGCQWDGERVRVTNGHRKVRRDSVFIPAVKGNGIPVKENAKGFRTSMARGLLRVLGVHGRESEMPPTKEHELFIPLPDEIYNNPILDANVAVSQFHELAKSRTTDDAELPFELKGAGRNGADDTIKLENGDIVYFRPDPKLEDGKPTQVAEVSISAIWRQSAGTPHQYFENTSTELLPFHRGRQTISLAEQMFGFVEVDKKDESTRKDHKSLALASRIRFTDGYLGRGSTKPFYGTNGDPVDLDEAEWFMLKELSSPKPPSPSLYFKRSSGKASYISKSELKPDNKQIAPQGRKFYLHQHQAFTGTTQDPWCTQDPDTDAYKRKSQVKLLRKDVEFYFAVDFDNLSENELALLVYALRPTEDFRHLIGMGKSLGLGRIRIEPMALMEIDRLNRYGSDDPFTAPRYHQVHCESALGGEFARLPNLKLFQQDRQALSEINEATPFLDQQRERAGHMIGENQRTILEMLGDPDSTAESGVDVHNPLRDEQDSEMVKLRNKIQREQHINAKQAAEAARERELFHWWVINDKTQSQQLAPIQPGKPLPKLERLKTPQPKNKHY